MCLKQELKLRSKNTNPKIKKLKITIFSNPSNIIKSEKPSKIQQTQGLNEIKSQTHPANSIVFPSNPANPANLANPSWSNPANPANPSWSNLVADKYYCVSDLKTEEEKNSRFADSRIKIPI